MSVTSTTTTCACWSAFEVRVSHEWLGSMVDLDGVSPKEVERRLTLTGTEVERTFEFAHGLEPIVMGEVVDLHPLRDSDHLNLALVRDGASEPEEVVCGAPNLFLGALVPWARPGTRLPGGMKIGRRRIRGTESAGMLCALDELGLGADHEGVLTLAPGEAVAGQPLSELFPGDTIYELEILSNRADCLCHLGVARELAAALGRTLTEPDTAAVERVGEPLAASVSVAIEADDLCSFYLAEGFSEIPAGPAPLYVRRRLMAVGQRSLGAVVDLANYVMLEVGQPLHTFDLDRVRGGDGLTRVAVRRARGGERILALDGQDRPLDSGSLVIAVNGRPAAIAGLIGSLESAVHTDTRNLLLEAASFQWTSIRSTSRRAGLRTEASARFERFLSPNLAPLGAARFARLLHYTMGVSPRPSPVTAGALPGKAAPIRTSATAISRLLGVDVSSEAAARALRLLDFKVDGANDEISATPPAARTDVTAPVDVTEEVGRILGYDSLPATLPPLRRPQEQPLVATFARPIAELMMGAGFTECVTLSLMDPTAPAPVAGLGDGRPPLLIGNPLSASLGGLRYSVLPGLLAACRLNQSRGRERIRLFERGTVFWAGAEGQRPEEPDLLAMVDHRVESDSTESGNRLRRLIAICQGLEGALATKHLRFTAAKRPGLHPGRTAEISCGGVVIGVVGELDSGSVRDLELRGRVVVAELRLDGWLQFAGRRPVAPRLARTPALALDLAVAVPSTAALGPALERIADQGPPELESVAVLDEYLGPGLPSGMKGWTFRLTLRDPSRTLTSREGEKLRDQVLQVLHTAAEAVVR